MELSANMATGNHLSPEVGFSVLICGYEKPETEFPASGSGRLPEVNAVEKPPETETSDGDQKSNERGRRHRRRKYGRLKRIRLEGLALPVADVATESESEKHFVVVDGPQVGIFRSPTTDADSKGRTWFNRKLINRNRKFISAEKPGMSRSGTAAVAVVMNSRQRCERYLKQFVAALFSTIGLLCLMVGYTVLGGYMFSRLESSNEVNVKADMRQVNTTLFILLTFKTCQLG